MTTCAHAGQWCELQARHQQACMGALPVIERKVISQGWGRDRLWHLRVVAQAQLGKGSCIRDLARQESPQDLDWQPG